LGKKAPACANEVDDGVCASKWNSFGPSPENALETWVWGCRNWLSYDSSCAIVPRDESLKMVRLDGERLRQNICEVCDAETCVSCGESKLRRARRYRTNTQYGRVIFDGAWLHECRQCGLVQVVPRPSTQALVDYYAVDYRRGGKYGSDVANAGLFPRDNLFYFNRGQSITELVSQYIHKENPRILDVGAGYGHILYSLGQQYPMSERVAIEYSNPCIQHLQSLGIQAYAQPVEEILPQMVQRFGRGSS